MVGLRFTKYEVAMPLLQTWCDWHTPVNHNSRDGSEWHLRDSTMGLCLICGHPHTDLVRRRALHTVTRRHSLPVNLPIPSPKGQTPSSRLSAVFRWPLDLAQHLLRDVATSPPPKLEKAPGHPCNNGVNCTLRTSLETRPGRRRVSILTAGGLDMESDKADCDGRT